MIRVIVVVSNHFAIMNQLPLSAEQFLKSWLLTERIESFLFRWWMCAFIIIRCARIYYEYSVCNWANWQIILVYLRAPSNFDQFRSCLTVLLTWSTMIFHQVWRGRGVQELEVAPRALRSVRQPFPLFQVCVYVPYLSLRLHARFCVAPNRIDRTPAARKISYLKRVCCGSTSTAQDNGSVTPLWRLHCEQSCWVTNLIEPTWPNTRDFGIISLSEDNVRLEALHPSYICRNSCTKFCQVLMKANISQLCTTNSIASEFVRKVTSVKA